jgi:hypothetical protein
VQGKGADWLPGLQAAPFRGLQAWKQPEGFKLSRPEGRATIRTCISALHELTLHLKALYVKVNCQSN